MIKEKIEVTGVVQGVGFRPFVHSLATGLRLGGYVLNTPDGVRIEVAGPERTIDDFAARLTGEAPPLSHIISLSRVRMSDDDGIDFPVFEIRSSELVGNPVTLISPDVCTCDECLTELFDPADRRYLYPFINCTNCGPRFTIIKSLPYDRPATTMASFTMCPACAHEYHDRADRRFHAQPDACASCGPALSLLEGDGSPVTGDPLTGAIRLLREGRIVAVKGLGGFHLVVDGSNEQAVLRLRERKHREEKPFALMAGTLADARKLITMTAAEEQVLTGRERPIVLALKTGNSPAAPSVAPRNACLGVMLPYTPVHFLLFHHPRGGGDFAAGKSIFSSLVMTSGNLSEEPICKDNDEARSRLSGIADAFLVHDRDIHLRSDDSVVTGFSGKPSFIRRSRGYAPMPVFLHREVPPILALGAELKNTVCLTEGKRAFISQHIGDLENLAALDFFREAIGHFKNILGLDPRILAYDLHPRYLSTACYRDYAENHLPGEYAGIGIQHHHAHIASVLAECGREDTVIGFALDGTGYGLDGTIWGGEILLANPFAFFRAGHLDTVPLPGGERAVREHWRMAFSWLRAAFGDSWRDVGIPSMQAVPQPVLETLDAAMKQKVNCPRTSSMGRLFDAAASLLDIRQASSYEGQGAMELEHLASQEPQGIPLPYEIRAAEPDPAAACPVLTGALAGLAIPTLAHPPKKLILDMRPAVRELVARVQNGVSTARLARDFHETLLNAFLALALQIRRETGIDTVALSGGCFQNRILSTRFPEMLRAEHFEVLTNRLIPVNDGGISLGQAYIAGSVAGNNFPVI